MNDSNIIAFQKKPEPPDLKYLEAKVKELAKNTENIQFEAPHVQERMAERGITMRQALEVLRNGDVISGPTLDQYNDWRIKLCRKVAGRRVQVVVAVKSNHLAVVTVI